VIHQGAEDFDVRIDRSPPQIAISGNATYATGNNLEVRATDGTAAPASARRSGVKSLLVSVAGTQVFSQSQGCDPELGSCLLKTPANFELSTVDFDEGPLLVTATAKDQLGDQVGLPHSHITTSTKTVYIGGPEGTVSITSGPGGYTASTTPTFTYTSTTTGSAFKCRVDSGPWVKCDPSGFTTGALTDGPHTFSVRNWHGPGTHPSPASRSFTVDTQGPAITATAPLGQPTPQAVGLSVESDVTVTDIGSGAVSISLALDGDDQDELTRTCPAGACPLQGFLDAGFTSDDSDGSHTYELTATDVLGNTSTLQGSLVLDNTAPVLSVTGDLPGFDGELLTSDKVDAIVDADDSRTGDTGVAEIQVLVDGEDDFTQAASCTYGCPSTFQTTYTYDQTSFEEGEHEVTIFATDLAGNTGRAEYEINVTPNPPSENCPVATPTVLAGNDVLDETQAAGGFHASVTAPSTSVLDQDSGVEVSPNWLIMPEDDAPFISNQSLASSTVGSVPAGGFGVDLEFCLMPMQTTADETPAATITHQGQDPELPGETETVVDAAVFANVATDTDLAVRATATGVTAIANVRGNQAPSELSWKLGLEEGLELRELSGGGLAIVDPTEDPQGLTVPTRNPDAEDIGSINDASVQLDESDYQLATAESELNEHVYAVLAEPYVVDEFDDVIPAPWSVSNGDVLTTSIPVGVRVNPISKQLVIPIFDDRKSKAPKPVIARYPSWVFPSDIDDQMYNWGCVFSQSLDSSNAPGGNRIRNLIVDFGPAQRDYRTGQGMFGGHDWLADDLISRETIEHALDEAIRGYNNCPHVGSKKMRLVFGLSNDQVHRWLDANDNRYPVGEAPNTLLAQNASLAGQRMHKIVGSVKRDRPHMLFGVGMDAEPGFGLDRPDLALKMARGMASGMFQAYDYGSAGNCRNAVFPDYVCRGEWGLGDVARISQGWPNQGMPIKVLPQIYGPKHVDDWSRVAKFWRGQGNKFGFSGIAFQRDSDPPGYCERLFGGGGREAWSKLHESKDVAPNLGGEMVQFDCPWRPFVTTDDDDEEDDG